VAKKTYGIVGGDPSKGTAKVGEITPLTRAQKKSTQLIPFTPAPKGILGRIKRDLVG